MKFIDPLRHRQLFLDDHAIGEAINLRRTLHQPTKYGPVLRPDRGIEALLASQDQRLRHTLANTSLPPFSGLDPHVLGFRKSHL